MNSPGQQLLLRARCHPRRRSVSGDGRATGSPPLSSAAVEPLHGGPGLGSTVDPGASGNTSHLAKRFSIMPGTVPWVAYRDGKPVGRDQCADRPAQPGTLSGCYGVLRAAGGGGRSRGFP